MKVNGEAARMETFARECEANAEAFERMAKGAGPSGIIYVARAARARERAEYYRSEARRLAPAVVPFVNAISIGDSINAGY